MNNLHPSIKYTFEKSKREGCYSYLEFLDIKVILHPDNTIERDIFYKSTNTHDYLSFYSAHPDHIKKNVPYNLAKRIIVFVSDDKRTIIRLNQLKEWLLKCDYPENFINKAFHNAKLQGPAPRPKNKTKTIPFITTYHDNIDNQSLVSNIRHKMGQAQSNDLKYIFDYAHIILSQRQPKNMLRTLTKAKFAATTQLKQNGLFKCTDKRCKICRLYIQECSNFTLSNGQNWEIRTHITCNALKVIYFLTCNFCKNTTYIGKTIGDENVGFKQRMNSHISECRTGESSCKFPKHVHTCAGQITGDKEPFFSINIMMKLHDPALLEKYEDLFHARCYDTMNSPSQNELAPAVVTPLH